MPDPGGVGEAGDDGLRMRTGTPDDVLVLYDLEVACFGPDAWAEPILWGELVAAVADAADLADAAVDDVDDPERSGEDGVSVHRSLLVAEDAGSVVAYGSFVAVAGTADLQRIAVDIEHRRRGVGRQLLSALIEAADRLGCTEMLLEVRADNPTALRLYRRHGFEPLAHRPRYYDRGRVDALVLRAPLPPTAPLTVGGQPQMTWRGPPGGPFQPL